MNISFKSEDNHTIHGTLSRGKHEKSYAILIHGITADRHEWGFFDFLVQELNQQGITTLAIDYRGHGESAFDFSDLTLSGILLDIEASFKYIQETHNQSGLPVTLIGNSFSGGLVYLFGQKNIRVHHVVMTCPVTSYISDISRVNSDWEQNLDTGFVLYAGRKIKNKIIDEMHIYDGEIASFASVKRTDIFHGLLDSDVPFTEPESFAKNRSPLVKIHGLEGMDHSFSAPEGSLNRDVLSKEFRKKVARFIVSVLGS